MASARVTATRPGRVIPGPPARRTVAAMWLRGYRRAWLGRDVVAGAVAACVVIPQAIAYASLAGLPVELGL